MAANTWPIECDKKMLEMIQFCVQEMGGAIEDELPTARGANATRLKGQLRLVNIVLAAVYKAKINLAVQQEVTKKGRKK